MVKLQITRKPPFLRLADVGLQRQVDLLRKENEQLRARIVDAQEEKAQAQRQAEDLRRQKERLRQRVISLKQGA